MVVAIWYIFMGSGLGMGNKYSVGIVEIDLSDN